MRLLAAIILAALLAGCTNYGAWHDNADGTETRQQWGMCLFPMVTDAGETQTRAKR